MQSKFYNSYNSLSQVTTRRLSTQPRFSRPMSNIKVLSESSVISFLMPQKQVIDKWHLFCSKRILSTFTRCCLLHNNKNLETYFWVNMSRNNTCLFRKVQHRLLASFYLLFRSKIGQNSNNFWMKHSRPHPTQRLHLSCLTQSFTISRHRNSCTPSS